MSTGVPTAEPASEPPRRYTNRSATYIGSLTLSAKVVERLAAFGVIALVASIYGATTTSDLYFIASIVPLTVGTVVGEAFATSLLPSLVQRQGTERFAPFLAASFWWAFALLLLLLAAYLGVVAIVVAAAAPAGSTSLLPWIAFSPTIVTLGLGSFLSALLLLYERYTWPPFRAAAATVTGLVLMLVTVAFTHDIVWIALATSAGYLISLILLAMDVRRGHGLAFLARPRAAALREAARLRSNVIVALAGGVLGGQSFVLVERTLAASMGVGAVSTISYARGVVFTPNMFGQAISMGLYPGMLRAYEAEDLSFVRGAFLRGLRLTLLIAGVIIVFFALYGVSVVRTLLQRGALSTADADAVAHALIAFSPAILGSMLLILCSRAFYAINYFRGIVLSQLAALVPYVPLALILRSVWGTNGLALAFGIGELIGGVFGAVLAGRLIGTTLHDARVLGAVVRPILLIGAIIGVLRIALDELPLTGDAQAFVLAVVGGAVTVAAVTAYLLASDWPEVAILRRYLVGAWRVGRGLRVRS